MICRLREDWGIEDPTGKSDEFFLRIIQIIEEKVLDLQRRIQENPIVLDQ
jgi:arsenate reductase (thioredoxin)